MLSSVLRLSGRCKAPPSASEGLSIEELKEQVVPTFCAPDFGDVARSFKCSQKLNNFVCQGNLAFKRAALLKSHCRFFWGPAAQSHEEKNGSPGERRLQRSISAKPSPTTSRRQTLSANVPPATLHFQAIQRVGNAKANASNLALGFDPLHPS